MRLFRSLGESHGGRRTSRGEDLFLEMECDSIRIPSRIEHVRSRTPEIHIWNTRTRLWRIERCGELYCSAVVAEINVAFKQAIIGNSDVLWLASESF